jgi:hypothetical protein
MELPTASAVTVPYTNLERGQERVLRSRVKERGFQTSTNGDFLYVENHFEAYMACVIGSVVGKYSHGVFIKVPTT